MEETSEIVLESELSAPSPQPKKKRRALTIIVDCALVLAFLLVVAVSANTIYLSAAYNLNFFVNGMSMYPTLNAGCPDRNGQPATWAKSYFYEGDSVDYGFAKSEDKDNWRGSLSRYDIVITYYPEDYQKTNGVYDRDAKGNLILNSNAKTKIKRLIGFPGETVLFEAVTEDAEMYNRAWGKTTINAGLEGEQVLKPLYTMADYPSINGRTYNYPTTSYAPWSLKDNEYFVMGDNRGNSKDSRTVGPILGEMIIGKAYLIIGQRKLDANLSPMNDWTYAFTPWNYRRIG